MKYFSNFTKTFSNATVPFSKFFAYGAVLILLGFIFFSHPHSVAAVTFNCQSNVNPSGNFNVSGSWTNCNGTTPQTTDTIEIMAGDTISLVAITSVAGVQVDSTGVLALSTFGLTDTGTGTGVK